MPLDLAVTEVLLQLWRWQWGWRHGNGDMEMMTVIRVAVLSSNLRVFLKV